MRKLLLTLHLYVGLAVGLLLVSAGLTGSVLVWKPEIDAALHPELLRAEPGAAGAAAVSLQAVVERVHAERPDAAVQWIRLPQGPRSTHEATVAVGGGHLEQVYVDPWRGSLLGARGATETPMNWLFHWHTSLLSGETGERVMGTAALGLLLLVASGLVVWWPGVRRLADAVRVKWRAGWKRVNFDLHRAGGFWASAALVLVAVTGSSLVFHDAYMAGLDRITRSPERPAPPVVIPLPGQGALPLDSLVRRGLAAVPGAELTLISLPQRPEAPVVVRSKLPSELHPNGRNFAYLHPQTGEVLAVQHAFDAPAGTRAYNVLYPLHIGRWGGPLSRTLYSLLGLVPLLLMVTGLLSWRNRTLGTRRRKRREKEAGNRARARELPRRAAARV